MEARRSLTPPFIILLSEAHFSSASCSSLSSSWFLKGVSVSLNQFLLFLCASPSDSGAEVTAFKDGFRVQRSPPSFLSTPTRRPFHSSLPFYEVCSLYGHFLQSLCHTHRSNLLIGAIKRYSCNKRLNQLLDNSRKCSDSTL